jgi:hypothetical protein
VAELYDPDVRQALIPGHRESDGAEFVQEARRLLEVST